MQYEDKTRNFNKIKEKQKPKKYYNTFFYGSFCSHGFFGFSPDIPDLARQCSQYISYKYSWLNIIYICLFGGAVEYNIRQSSHISYKRPCCSSSLASTFDSLRTYTYAMLMQCSEYEHSFKILYDNNKCYFCSQNS